VLFYYLGGSIGITISGYGYEKCGWTGVTGISMVLLAVILMAGVVEVRAQSNQPVDV
jgi:YNFM family putative membrane transporter